MKPLFFLLAMPALLLAETHVVSKIGSERATSGSGAKIATFDGKTHVVWQDRADDGGYLNQVRSFVHASGEWTETFTLNRDKSNHARPVITVDERAISTPSSAVTTQRLPTAARSSRMTPARGPSRRRLAREPTRRSPAAWAVA